MSNLPNDLKYTESHEWIRDIGDGCVAVGITDHAQNALGELVYIDLPEVGATVERSDDACVVESVKAASDVYAPLSGEITEINSALEDDPAQVNKSPYDDGWLFKLRLSDAGELDKLLSTDAYRAQIEADD